jgi:hypothetical protein
MGDSFRENTSVGSGKRVFETSIDAGHDSSVGHYVMCVSVSGHGDGGDVRGSVPCLGVLNCSGVNCAVFEV